MYNAPRASVLWFLLVLMLSVYTRGYFWPAYIRRSNVFVPAESGHYIQPSSSIYFHHLLKCYMHVHFSFYSYTVTRSSDSLNLHIQICGYLLLIRYLERITGILRNLEFSLFDYRYSCLTFIPVDSLFSIYITFSCHSILYSYDIMSGHLYVLLQCYHIIMVIDIACLGYFRLSMYT